MLPYNNAPSRLHTMYYCVSPSSVRYELCTQLFFWICGKSLHTPVTDLGTNRPLKNIGKGTISILCILCMKSSETDGQQVLSAK